MNRADQRFRSQAVEAARARAKKRQLILYGSFAFLAIVVVVAIALANRVPKAASTASINAPLAVGQVAPNFDVSTTAGPFDLAHAGGKPTLLEVFATWCPHCQRETVTLNDLQKHYGDRINIVAVDGSPYGMDGSSTSSQADAIAFQQRFNVAYPLAFDPDLGVAQKYLQGGFPTMVLIGADGKVQAIASSEITEAALAKNLGASLAGKAPNPKLG